MKLTASDLDFIKLISESQADHLQACLEGRPPRLDVLCRMLTPSRSVMWRDYFKLVAQVMRATLRKSPAGPRAIVFWSRLIDEHPKRHGWLRRFLGDVDPFGISMKSRIVRGLGLSRTVKVLLGLAKLLMRSDVCDSELASSYVLIVRTCMMAGSHAAAAGAREAYIFLIYRPETPFVAAWLMQDGVRVHQVALTTPLLPHTHAVVADDVVLCNPYQEDELKVLRQEREWPPAVLWGPQEIVELEECYGYAERPFLPDTLAMYTQGFRMRVRRGIDLESSGTAQAEHEELLGRTLVAYLDAHPEATLRVFPHPMERRWFLETGEHDLGALVGHPRVTIDWEGASSVRQFGEVGLGIMGYSTVGFDRVFMGFPTIFFMPKWMVDSRIRSPYEALFVSEPDDLLNAIDSARPLTPAQYMTEHFGAAFRAPDHAEPASATGAGTQGAS